MLMQRRIREVMETLIDSSCPPGPGSGSFKIPDSRMCCGDHKRIDKRLLGLLVFLTALLSPMQIFSADTLTSVLEHIRIRETRNFSYRETRYLQLLAEPWQATGDMYISPQQMVIAQQAPTEVMTTITAKRMLYIDVEQDIHRSLKLERPFAVPGMEPFMQLLYGTTGYRELEQDYVISFDTTGKRWSLQLAPQRRVHHDIVGMRLAGDSGQGPDRLVLAYEDGDRREWQLALRSQGAAASRDMQETLSNY
jgi:hypothetical protein